MMNEEDVDFKTIEAFSAAVFFDDQGNAILEHVRAANLDTNRLIVIRDRQTAGILIAYGAEVLKETNPTNGGGFCVVELDFNPPELELFRFLKLIEGLRSHQDCTAAESLWIARGMDPTKPAIDRREPDVG
jgi:hypothetical protein